MQTQAAGVRFAIRVLYSVGDRLGVPHTYLTHGSCQGPTPPTCIANTYYNLTVSVTEPLGINVSNSVLVLMQVALSPVKIAFNQTNGTLLFSSIAGDYPTWAIILLKYSENTRKI